MFGSAILEVAVGVIFVFLLVSIICTAIREGIESWLKTRAAFLEHGIRELLHDRGAVGLARAFYTHPLINSLYAGDYTPGPADGRPSPLANGGELPSYIPARNVALTLFDIAARGAETVAGTSDAGSPVLTLPAVRASVSNIENRYVQRALLTAIDTAQGDLDKAVANLAAWYDSAMDRVSGGYKRATQQVLFVIGLVVAVGMNVDTIALANFLYRNDDARAALAARAEAAARDSTLIRHDSTNSFRRAQADLDSLALPIGWDHMQLGFERTPSLVRDSTGVAAGALNFVFARPWWRNVLSPVLGWLLTALAATLGAPFWFDVLNKVMVVRSTVKPHEKSPEESSEDRQKGAARTTQLADNAVGSVAHPQAPPQQQQQQQPPQQPPPPPADT
jgi:hypothetical protein